MSSPLPNSVMTCAMNMPLQDSDLQDISNKQTTDVPRTLPISAPVPVWCASLGKDALRSILEMRDEESCAEEIQAHISDKREEPDVVTDKNRPLGRPLPYTQNGGNAEPKMVVRPITPSTLIALTEPCLMAWCYANAEENPDLTNGDRYGESSPDRAQMPHDPIQGILYSRFDCVNEVGRMRNVWGY